MQKINRVLQRGLLLIMLAGYLTGCRVADMQEGVLPSHSTEAVQQSESLASTSVSAEAAESAKTEEKVLLDLEPVRSAVILPDGENVYYCGTDWVSCVNTVTGAETVLWEQAEYSQALPARRYAEGAGMLLGDMLYFVEVTCDETGKESRALSRIAKDGSNYEQLLQLGNFSENQMYFADGVLSVCDMDWQWQIPLYADGTWGEAVKQESSYIDRVYYICNGRRFLFPEESLKEFGFYFVYRDWDYPTRVDAQTGEASNLEELAMFNGYNSTYYLCNDYVDGHALRLVDRDSLEQSILYETERLFDVIGLDEEYVYLLVNQETEAVATYYFEKVSLKDGSAEIMFAEEEDVLFRYSPQMFMDVVVKDNYIYYVKEIDCNYYKVRRDVNDSAQYEVLGDPILTTGISQMGEVVRRAENTYHPKQPDKIIHRLDLSWLHVNDSYAGADEINRYLDAEQEMNVAERQETIRWLSQEAPMDLNASSLDSRFEGFSYQDDRYISFVQKEYYYESGAAHGMPVWIGYTFDLETGQRLFLQDIIGDSEEELKELVGGYFAEKINKSPEEYWPDSIQSVYEWTSFESDFYLTDEGIAFYYGPYDLACYAAGFQEVTIPYAEFECKILQDK